jgi:predicted Zn-dependent protease
MALGHYSAARESAEKAKSLPNSATAAVALLVALDLRDGKNDAAAEEVAGLRKARPNDPSAALLAGDVALNAKQFEAAALAYERSYKLRPSSAAAIKAYGARMQGKLPRPAATLENWLQEQPGDVAARMVLASALAARGANDQAIDQYELLARDARPNPLALNNLAWLYFQQGDRRAAAIAKRAFDAAPQSSAIADTYGWILLKDKQVAQALPILERAAKGSNPPPEIRYHYAVALVEAGQRDRALQIIREVTSGAVAFPEMADARRLLAELEG